MLKINFLFAIALGGALGSLGRYTCFYAKRLCCFVSLGYSDCQSYRIFFDRSCFCIKTEIVYRPRNHRKKNMNIFWDYIITECYSIIYNQAIYFSSFLLLD